MTLNERNQWRSDSVTKELIRQLEEQRDEIKELWAMSSFPQAHQEVEMRGIAGAIKDVLILIDNLGGLDESNRQLGNEAGLH